MFNLRRGSALYWPVLTVIAFHSSTLVRAQDVCTAITKTGAVEGLSNGAVCSYKGIPYAAPPLGKLRWKPPAPAIAWKGSKSTIDYGSMCLQTEASGDPGSDIVGSEDCLTLNVWTPSKPPDHLPVMVWIHGGHSTWGSSGKRSLGIYRYDGKYLAEHAGIVVVSINYRLGPLGFLSFSQLSAENSYHGSGNYGHMDQIAALEWIKQNIAAFGGDPNKVTIFGHAAGGTAVMALLSSPRAKGLFAGAIQQSGGYPFLALRRMEYYGNKLVHALGCDKSPAVTQCMRAKPASDLLTELPEAVEKGAPFYKTVIDGYVLTKPAKAVFEAGEQNDVPVISGVTADEESTILEHYLGKNSKPKNESDYGEQLENFFTTFEMQKVLDEIEAKFPYDRFATPAQTLIKATSEWDLICPNRRFLKAAASGHHKQPFYRYYFSHVFHEGGLKELGAGHGMELPYLFHIFPAKEDYQPDQHELNLSNAMMSYWTSFAKNQVPSQLGLPSWPEYEADSDPYLELDNKISTHHGLLSDDCDFWDKLSNQHWSAGALTARQQIKLPRRWHGSAIN